LFLPNQQLFKLFYYYFNKKKMGYGSLKDEDILETINPLITEETIPIQHNTFAAALHSEPTSLNIILPPWKQVCAQ
jgi:hypothetical protein